MQVRQMVWQAPRMLPLWSKALAATSSALCGAMPYQSAFTVLEMLTKANCDTVRLEFAVKGSAAQAYHTI